MSDYYNPQWDSLISLPRRPRAATAPPASPQPVLYPMNTGDRDRQSSAALRGAFGNRGAGSALLQPARDNGGLDQRGWALDELLGIYNDEGTYVPGTPGYTISRARERAAANAAGSRAEADRASNYADIDQMIRGRAPAIGENYDRATADLRANAQSRAIETRAGLMQQNQDAARAAAEMGLATVPPATQRATAAAEGGISKVNQNAESWAGLNASNRGRALERNDAVGDTFVYQGQLQRQELASLLQELLAGMQDQYVGGTAGGIVGGTSQKDRLSILDDIIRLGGDDFDEELATGKFRQASGPSRGGTGRSAVR